MLEKNNKIYVIITNYMMREIKTFLNAKDKNRETFSKIAESLWSYRYPPPPACVPLSHTLLQKIHKPYPV